jgi:iron complex transport system permease protein
VFQEKAKRLKLKNRILLGAIVILFFLVCIMLSLWLGPAHIPLKDVVKFLFSGSAAGEPNSVIFWQIRMPRVLLAVLVGASLAVAGTLLQGLFLNPLTDPYVTGVSSGAALGATLSFFFRLPSVPWLSLFAFLGGILTLVFVYTLAKRGAFLNIPQLLLGGVTISYLFFALVSILMIKSGKDLHAVFYWLLGSFSGRSWNELKIALVVIPFLLLPFFFTDELNILLQGEERALELGVDVEKVKKILFFTAAFLTAVAVSVSGIIGFVGLVVPHISRLLLGPDHRRVLSLSIFLGASIMCLSDLFARVVFAPSEMPVGIVTIFFGAPFFIYLLRRRGG